MTRRRAAMAAFAMALLLGPIAIAVQTVDQPTASAHSVGLRNTRVFFSPQSAALLAERAATSGGGIQVGDVLEYIVEFEPFENGAVNGPGGYVTFYPPAGTRVVGASMVELQGNDFVDIPIGEPGVFYDGVGPNGSQAPFGAPFATTADGSLAQLYGDTGIFFSTDPRTAKYVGGADPDTTSLGNNGYPVNPTACGQLIPATWDNCWAHNEWDRDMTDTMGTKDGSIIASGRGNTPYLAGSPVAGPESYYNLDHTGSVGPWQRIQYPGSQIGTGPAPDPASPGVIAPTAATAWVPVTPGVNDGRALSEVSPLPDTTTAVRFSVGALTADETSSDDLMWAKIRLEVVEAPTACFPIDSEVFGGDAGADDNGKDNMWRYYVPISATNNACLVVSKSGPESIEVDSAIQYTVTVANISPETLSNVIVRDTLDSSTTFVGASDGGTHSAGVVTWPTIATLAPGDTRVFTVDVVAPSTTGFIENNAIVSSDETAAVHALWATEVVPVGPPSVSITKTPSVSSIDEPGGPVTFSLVMQNDSSRDVTLTSLVDDVFGDLLDTENPSIVGNTCTSLPATWSAGASFACSFDALVIGDASDPDHLDTVTLSVQDAEATVATAQADATVAFDDVAPTATVDKSPSVGTVTEPGGTVEFTVRVTNTTVESVALVALVDDVFGDLLDAGNGAISANTCPDLGTTIAPDSTETCSFSADLTGLYGDPDHVDVVTATLSDDDGNTVTTSDDAVVAFGPANSTVSGRVFEDLDLDGIRDAGEPGLAGVDLVVTGEGGSPTIVTTAGDGTWQVAVLPGTVTVEVDASTVPATHTLTTANDSQVVTAVVDTDVATEDVGYGPPAGSITGTVFLDLDGDPDQDAYEPGFDGVTVTLLDDVGGTVATVETDAVGAYAFADLSAGTYTVVVDAVDVGFGYAASVDPDGTTDDETRITLAIDEDIIGVDFGYAGIAVVGDTVWIDEDENGLWGAGEPKLEGVEITLIWAGPDGTLGTSDDYLVGTVVSDADGGYIFGSLPPGIYRLVVSVADAEGAGAPTTSTDIDVALDPGEEFWTADFGFARAEELPFTGLDAEQLIVTAALFIGLGWLVLADGRKRNREFEIALGRIGRDR